MFRAEENSTKLHGVMSQKKTLKLQTWFAYYIFVCFLLLYVYGGQIIRDYWTDKTSNELRVAFR
jgi:hypothetical protein